MQRLRKEFLFWLIINVMKELMEMNTVLSSEPRSDRTLVELLGVLDLNLSSNPRGTDKGDFKTYVRGFYEAEFGRRQSDNIRLLEIGVRTGASIALWANFFRNVEIIGLDVEDVGTAAGPVPEYLDYPSVKFYCNDAYNPEFAQSLAGSFSIMIDDGPHSLISQKRFVELYLPKLADGGVLIIEDIQRDYRDSYQLMKALPKGNKFIFEVYDFRAQSGAYDDFLFVVRQNKSGKNHLTRKMYLMLRSLFSWVAAPYQRIKRFLIS